MMQSKQHGDAKGHCHHAPLCIGLGYSDERDPLGCCRCGDRLRENARELYDALQAAWSRIESFGSNGDPSSDAVIERCFAALKKARGEA